jgi:hypothetical protein
MPISYSEDWYSCQHYSSRGGSGIVQVTFHTAEGAKTNASLANWLGDPASQVSYHASVDDERGVVARYVDSDSKAWSQAGGNPFCLSVCFCAFVAWSTDEWRRHDNMLQNAAAIARTFCDWYGIPISALNASQAQSAQRGISQHVDGGTGWSNHSDCGPNFPESYVLDLMRGSTAPPSQPKPTTGGNNVVSSATDPDGGIHYACLSDSGQVLYFPPGWENWGVIDPSQKGALSGTGISISPDWLVTLTYTNGSKKPCKYYHKFRDPDPWVWAAIGDTNAR